MDALQFEEMPDMRHPYLLLTYEGWSNAAGVATATGEFLIEHLQAKRFASIDPEEFYSFAEQRPQARYNDAGQREIIWPQNDFYFCAQPQLDHDIIIATGVEPHLKWRTFTNLMIDFIKQCKVYQTVTLGASGPMSCTRRRCRSPVHQPTRNLPHASDSAVVPGMKGQPVWSVYYTICCAATI
jgi:proteasome assembly chaperone (PAC2) family protein